MAEFKAGDEVALEECTNFPGTFRYYQKHFQATARVVEAVELVTPATYVIEINKRLFYYYGAKMRHVTKTLSSKEELEALYE